MFDIILFAFLFKKYTIFWRERFYVKNIFMQAAPLIITPEHTLEERMSLVTKLVQRINSKNTVREAYDRLFWTQLPHVQIERLIRMNSRALVDDYNKRLFRILSENPAEDFYNESEFIEEYEYIYAPCWNDGKLIARWQRFTKHPNPHHILPESRGWTNNPKNFWFVDRLTHNDFHTVFQNLTPTEQLIFLLNFHKQVLSDDFTQAIRSCLYSSFREPVCYKKWVIRKDYRESGWSKRIISRV
jgi:hypothetical protein